MSGASQRQRIVEGIKAALVRIHVADGFQTDAGDVVHLGEIPEFGTEEGDPSTAIAAVIQDDQIEWQQNKFGLVLPVEIQAQARAGVAEPWIAAEEVLADIKRAMEQPDRTLGGLTKKAFQRGLTRSLPREAGSLVVGIGISYVFRYEETWGAP